MKGNKVLLRKKEIFLSVVGLLLLRLAANAKRQNLYELFDNI